MSATTRPQDIVIGALGQDYLGKVKALVAGTLAVSKGDLVEVTSLSFDVSRGIPRAGSVTQVTSAKPTGALAIASNDAAVGRQVVLVNWLPFQMDTSAGAIGDPVYCTATGTPTLIKAVDGAVIIGKVVTVGTVANGGAVFLESPGAAGADAAGILSGTATVLDTQTSIVIAVGASLDGKLAVVSFAEAPTAAALIWAGPVAGGNLTINIDVDNTADIDVHYVLDGR